jgi:hypothetical protein
VHDEELISGIRAEHGRISASERRLLRLVADADRSGAWEDSGARDTAHWLAMALGISEWKARRWVVAAHALEGLPHLSNALASGELGLDKVVELARFATPADEARLIRWALGVSCARIRERADEATRRSLEGDREADRAREVSWWSYDEGRRFAMHAELTGAEGAQVVAELEREASRLPMMPGEEHEHFRSARLADALVALVCGRGGDEVDRPTVVVHAPAAALVSGIGGCRVEGGPVIHAETVRRWLCTAKLQAVVEDESGDVVRVGRAHADPPAWMVRQLRYRDRECRFPACGARRFLQAHHITWRTRGGRTELSNLVLTCFFHHKLVHEHGWSVHRARDGTVRWFGPDGTRYVAGPAPPVQALA